MGNVLKKPSAKELTGWAERQAEIIVDSFLADGAPEDLLRLEQAIAAALRAAYERGQAVRSVGMSNLSGRRDSQGRKSR